MEEENTELHDEAMELTPFYSQMDAKKILQVTTNPASQVIKDSDLSVISQLDNAHLKTVRRFLCLVMNCN